ncbi:MAG: T9SS type A sorting domain-containing protein [Bacteroidota bacterium]
MFLAVSVAAIVGYGVRQGHPTESSLATPQEAKAAEDWQQEQRIRKQRDKQQISEKFDSPNEFAKYHMDIRTPYGANGPQYPAGYRLEEYHKMQRQFSARGQATESVNATWVERGPNNVAGRARALIVDPEDATDQTWFVGTAGGGIWKTTDKGANWSNLTPDLPNLAVTTLAMASSNTDIIYAGTGEGFGNGDAIRGDGIFKSEDHGVTWEQIESTAGNSDFFFVNKILVNPADENELLSANNAGLYRSTDGGASWTEVLDPPARVQDLDVDPNNWNRQYASVNSYGVYRSDDAGLTWEDISEGLPSLNSGASVAARFEMAISPVNPNKIFLSTEMRGENDAVFFTNDGGDTWNQFSDNGGLNPELLGGQGWYDNTIVAHPYDENRAFLAGVEIFSVDLDGSVSETDPQVLGASSSADFISFVDFGGTLLGGGMEVTSLTDGVDLEQSDFTGVEIRFGPGLSQMAHRFTVPEDGGTNGDGGAGVPAEAYTYQDYVEVPFQVWDVTNNIQLNASFRDQEDDGTFDLEVEDPADGSRAREYIFINATPYDAATPDANISTVEKGHFYKQLYFFWGRLREGSTWDPANVPEATIEVEYGTTIRALGDLTVNSDPYGRYSGPNGSVHPDHHNLFVVPKDESTGDFWLINLNDGGGSLSEDNGTTIAQWGTTMHTSQFYGADKSPGAERYIGGMQDNGTYYSPSLETASSATNYIFGIGGDGFESIWNFADPNQMIGASQFNGITRTEDGGATWQGATSGMSDRGSGNAPFISRLGNGKRNPDLLFAVGPSGVWRSPSFGRSWSLINMGADWGLARRTQVNVSHANPAIVWAGGTMGTQGDLYFSTDYGQTFQAAVDYPDIDGPITGLDPHSTEDSTAFATFSFFGQAHVLRTTDLGQTWEDLSQMDPNTGESANGFPNVATYCAITMPHAPEVIWVGTDIGIVESIDNGESWHMLEGDLPAVAVWEMKVADGEIVVATHGRGIWSAVIPELPGIGMIPEILVASINLDGELQLGVDLRSMYDSSHVLIDGELSLVLAANASVGEGTITGSYTGEEGEKEIIVVGYLDGVTLPSMPFAANLAAISPVNSYGTSFGEDTNSDFFGNGFSIQTQSGFIPDDYAIHSEHPYGENETFVYQLAVPIVVADADAYMGYKDVAIVEKGSDGALYGTQDFFDYVVVQGSNDGGLTWADLANGYDASFSSSWSTTYDAEGNGSHNQYVDHLIDLHETYSAGEVIQIRFKLFSDPFVTGWGWAIDELHIQDSVILDRVTGLLAPTPDYSMSVYPNPARTATKVSFLIEAAQNVELMITDLQGKTIFTHDVGFKSSGQYEEEIPLRDVPPGSYVVSLIGQNGVQSMPLIVN